MVTETRSMSSQVPQSVEEAQLAPHPSPQSIEHVLMVGDLANRGLLLLEGQAPELRDLSEFYERGFPGLLERWEQQHQGRKEKRQ